MFHAAATAATSLVRLQIWKRFAPHVRARSYTTEGFGGAPEIVAPKEDATMAEARGVERIRRAKKNPRLAIVALES
jgi:hypothetical protein